jgi:hypothetical protein
MPRDELFSLQDFGALVLGDEIGEAMGAQWVRGLGWWWHEGLAEGLALGLARNGAAKCGARDGGGGVNIRVNVKQLFA